MPPTDGAPASSSSPSPSPVAVSVPSDLPSRIDCGLPSVSAARYARDYYVNDNGRRAAKREKGDGDGDGGAKEVSKKEERTATARKVCRTSVSRAPWNFSWMVMTIEDSVAVSRG